MTDGKLKVTITATRHKHGTWKVHATYPSGGRETHAGLVDDGHASFVAGEIIAKVERDHLAAAGLVDQRSGT